MADGIKKYLDQEGLAAYDAKIKEYAKNYADSLSDNYDAAGSATTAESNAKGYTDALADGQVKINKEAIETLNGDASTTGSVAKAVADAKATVDADVDAIEEDLGNVDNLSTTNKTLVGAINEVMAAIGTGGTAAVVTMTKSDDGLQYTIKQGEATVGTIDIPKDMVVESGSVVTLEDGDVDGCAAGTYIKLILANVAEPLYINVGTLVDIYVAKANAAQVQVAINSATREISATIVAGSITATELADGSVTTAKIADANVTKAKLSTEVQRSLEDADATKTALEEEVSRATGAEAQVLTDAKAYADSKVEGVDLTGIAANASDIADIKASLAEGGATANAIADAKKAGTDASAAVTALETGAVASNTAAISALEEKVGDGFTPITTDEINALFA